MILIDFLAMILLYFVHKVSDLKPKDMWGDALMSVLMAFGILFLFIDSIEKIKGLF